MEDGKNFKVIGDGMRSGTRKSAEEPELSGAAAEPHLEVKPAEPPETWEHHEDGLTMQDFLKLHDTSGGVLTSAAIFRAWYKAVNQNRASWNATQRQRVNDIDTVPRKAVEQVLRSYEEDTASKVGSIGPKIAEVFRQLLDHTRPAEPRT